MHNGGMWDGGKEYTQVEKVFLPWIVGAVLRVDVEFFTLQTTKHKGVYGSTGEEMRSTNQLISSASDTILSAAPSKCSFKSSLNWLTLYEKKKEKYQMWVFGDSMDGECGLSQWGKDEEVTVQTCPLTAA